MSRTVKFLWLSDIHYLGDGKYIGYESIAFGFVKEKIEDAFTGYEGILYILLSGDLAFSGGIDKDNKSINQYNQLKNQISNCSDKYKSRIRVLVCPGNHDVSWGSFKEMYKNTMLENSDWADSIVKIFDFKYDKETVNESYHFSKTKFLSLFSEFSKSLSYTGIKSSLVSNVEPSQLDQILKNNIFVIEKDDNLDISNEYIDTALEGFIIDKSNQVIFIIVNTAWYSIGESLNIFLNNFKGISKFEQEEIIKIIEASQEYGKSYTGFRHLESAKLVTEIKEKIRKFEHYTKICMMHHPLEWLDWNEKESYDSDHGIRAITPLIDIIKECDLLLTGHVHPSRISRSELLFNNVNHLRGPLFLSHHTKSKERLFPCNGFVSIELNVTEDNYKITKNGTVHYHNFEHGSESGLSLNKQEEKLPLRLKGYNKNSKTSVNPEETEPKIEPLTYNDVYYDITTKDLKKEFLSNFLGESISEIEALGTKSISVFNYNQHVFIFQRNNSWLNEIDLFNIFRIVENVETIRLLKAGHFIANEDKSLDYNHLDFNTANKALLKYSDSKLNELRTSFFNILDQYISESYNSSTSEEKVETVSTNEFENYLNRLSDPKEIIKVFKAASSTSFSNHVIGSEHFIEVLVSKTF
ncbi:MAG: metallophosphoesterase [Saprospiraceae bacterium]|nr:metallophosphoesterase [Saprospiraceae bacterium]